MKIINCSCKSKKYKGLLIGFLQLDDGSVIRLSGKPECGEQIERKARRIKLKLKGGDPTTLPHS